MGSSPQAGLTRRAFLDTNIFLHYRSVEQVDWLRVLGAGQVELLVAPVVYRELDTQKDRHPVAKMRKRAAGVVSHMNAVLGEQAFGEVRPNVLLTLLHREPVIDFKAHHLSETVPDDRLIATMLQYAGDQGVDRADLVLVAADYLARVKATAQGFKAVPLDDECRLPPETTEEEKRVAELEAEVRRLAGRAPKLQVSFAGGESYLKIGLKPVGPLSEQEIEARMADVRRKYPLIAIAQESNEPGRDPGRAAAIAVDRMAALALAFQGQDIEARNERHRGYHRAYHDYLEREDAYRQRKSRSIVFSLDVSNVGTAIARDIDLVVESTAVVRVIEKADSKRPRPPSEPITERDPWAMTPAAMASLNFRPPAISALAPDVSTRVDTLKDGFRIEAHIRKLKHTVMERLGPFVLSFPSVAAIEPLTMHYRLNSESLLENLEGDLHLVAAVEAP
jgi:hypothetical protein